MEYLASHVPSVCIYICVLVVENIQQSTRLM